MALVAGVDCSTQATKVLVLDSNDGRVVASAKADHDVTGTGGARETDPKQWWDALATALSKTGRAGEVQAIGIAGQQHGLVVLDTQDEPLRPAMLWNDVRAAPDASRLVEAWGGPDLWADRIGLVPVASYTVSKWAWLRRTEPGVARAVAAIFLPHDFLNYRLTGTRTTDRGDASGTGWWSSATEDYSSEVLELNELDVELLPKVLRPGELAGTVTPAAAKLTGLKTGTLVSVGTGDNMAAALGLGLETGTPVISLGTSGTAYAVSMVRATDPSGAVAGFADATGRFLPLAATLNCTLAIDRVAEWIGLGRDEAAEETDVVFFPFLDGERTPNLPNASGVMTGLRHGTERKEILLAAYEGAALGLIEALEEIAAHSSGINDDALILIGGGAKGRTWRRVVGQLSGRALQIPEAEELVALGAAAQACGLIEGVPGDEVARRWDTRRGVSIEPTGPALAIVDRLRQARRELLGA